MISRHYLVEIKRVKELPLSTLSLPHHGPLPRITSQSDGITARPWSQRDYCNSLRGKADRVHVTACRFWPKASCIGPGRGNDRHVGGDGRGYSKKCPVPPSSNV